ncbi:transmembrane protein 70 homolog, mitochondrial-like [Acanthaster planci]|uniref:Transmembrane protein 70 homolog, mitochondrial-like n=1 Tax=Acanthaster planci TaxID=133434 RepID=A0A8B7YFD8_ACAPL|nr:transmembrane protein 70 homolog, mitochondrial-like [Acanthaster planci]
MIKLKFLHLRKMAFRTRCFPGLFRLHWGRNFIFHNFHKHNHDNGRDRLLHSVSVLRMERAFAEKSLKRMLCIHSMEVIVQCTRAMSQFSPKDTDVQRMQQVLEQSGRQPMGGDSESRLIYEVRSLGMMRFCTLLFYVTALTGLYASPDLISSALEHDTVNNEMILSFLTLSMAVVVLPVLLTMFNNRLVLRMYYSNVQQSYVTVTQTPLLTLRRTTFCLADVVPTKRKPGSLLGLFNMNTLRAKDRPYFINPYNFKIPSDYNRIMGYQ